ncbi:MAG TPA: Fmu (Sun) domain-containing protein [Chitinophagaceae bacterium]|nr:Fmu (Sun) domain-containing protein [Chitinophagaceae bacterium]
MSRFHSYINSAKEILSAYDGQEPFASFLKKYFSLHKKFGSRDRKQVSHLCYCYFRLGKAHVDMSVEEKIVLGLFLCSTAPNELLEGLKPDWNQQVTRTLTDKLVTLGIKDSINVFPWKEELSEGIDFDLFNVSFFIQPDLFLRTRPEKEQIVMRKLEAAGLDFSYPAVNCIALPNAAKIDALIELNREAVIQDLSSQKTGELLENVTGIDKKPLRVWDCCAASGGKSIMAVDLLGGIDLTVSDIRKSILHNLDKRFSDAGITKYKSLVADLSVPGFRLAQPGFDLIIADLPCTGSGTWSRTPEQLFYFDKQDIIRYAALQKDILANLVPHLNTGGFILYITCSVFKKENEENIQELQSNFPLSLKKIGIIAGYDKKADSMFAALLQKL